MKVLFIASKKFDYGQDLAYSGLVEALGGAHVRDYPWNVNFHLPIKKYPMNLGRSKQAGLTRSLQAKHITPKNADLVIVGSCKVDAFEHYLKCLPQIPSSTPVALIDGGDREEIGGDLERLGRKDLWKEAIKKRDFNFIFKREYLKNKDYPDHVFPMPFSINLDALGVSPTENKDKDLSFWAVESHPIRTQALELLKNKFDCSSNGTQKGQSLKGYKYKGRSYHEELAKCRMVLSLRGGGWDTLRYWEVPALGPLMISTELGILIPNDFEDKKHIIKCADDLSDLIELGNYYLKNENERLKIAKAGHEHLKKHHTNLARAQFLLDSIKN